LLQCPQDSPSGADVFLSILMAALVLAAFGVLATLVILEWPTR
jgi:hypothetical protein